MKSSLLIEEGDMMLTNDLMRVRTKGKNIEPILLKNTPKYKGYAEQLVDLFLYAEKMALSRAEIVEVIRDLTALEVDHKILKGLSKIMLDRCEFIIPSLPLEDPPSSFELRMRVFQAAAQEGSFSQAPIEQRKSRNEILEYVCSELNLEDRNSEEKTSDNKEEGALDVLIQPKELEAALYADLKELHLLSNYNGPKEGDRLLERYNISMCQALLLRSTSVVVEIPFLDIKWLRFLFRYIKFHQLIYDISTDNECAIDEEHFSEMMSSEEGLSEDCSTKGMALTIKLDGPQSLFKQSTRYGMQLALFFPALVALPCSWTLNAEVLWGKKRKFRKKMTLSAQNNLKSHYKALGVWRSRAEEVFEDRYNEYYVKEQKAAESGKEQKKSSSALSSKKTRKKLKPKLWKLNRGRVVLGKGQQVFFPDFCFTHNNDSIFMEIVGFWRGGELKKKIKSAPKNYFFVVSKRLAGEAGKKIGAKEMERVVDFAEVISLPKVVKKLEDLG